MEVSLNIRQAGHELFAELTFLNPSAEAAYLLKYKAGVNGKISNRLFTIVVAPDGEKIKYTGMLKKRKAPTAKDYVMVPPGESLKTIIRIDEAYAFSSARQTYTIHYAAIHSSPDEAGELAKIVSPAVSFEYP